ncbi:MAG: AzlC family ABC transporter permease [Pseudomonadota bacterium]
MAGLAGEAVFTARGILRGALRLGPIAIFIIPFGIAYGAAAIEAGMTAAQAIGTSALVFAGASQFAVLDLWDESMALATVVLVVLAVNARHVLLGAALARWLNGIPPVQRYIAATWISDANFADTQKAFEQGERDVAILLGGGLVMWVAWVAGTAFGAMGSANFVDPSRWGVDVLMPAFFAAVVAPGVTGSVVMGAAAVVAAVVAVASLPYLPAGWSVILAALAGGLVGAFARAR